VDGEKLDELTARQILVEYGQRVGIEKDLAHQDARTIDFGADLFSQQREFIEDPSRYKAILSPRRSGKTYVSAYYLIKTCYETPGTKCLFLALTASSAFEIIWDVIRDICERYQVEVEEKIVTKQFVFPNGSKILLAGADNMKEITKQRGKGYKLIVIDECGYQRYLKELVNEAVGPTMLDYKDSVICLIGTPGLICAGLFYEITEKNKPGWSVYKWSISDNTKLAALEDATAEEVLRQIKLTNEWDDQSPEYIREYLGRWVQESSSFIYKFNYELNTYTKEQDFEYDYLFGLDFGIADPSAIVVAKFSKHTKTLYVEDCFKQNDINPERMCNIIKSYYDKYKPIAMIADGNGIGAAFLSQLNSMYQLPIIQAEKKDKIGFIELINDDLRQGKIKIKENLIDMQEEMLKLQWKDSILRIFPEPADDHLCDSLLYLWRYSTHYLGKKPKKKPSRDSNEWADDEFRKHLDELQNQQEQSWWENL
jgi:hypothetical protein